MRSREEVTVEGLDIDAIVASIDEFPVTLAILYGSYARGDARETSDIDLAVEFDDSLTSVERTQTRVALIERVSTAVGADDVDVIPLARAPPSLVADILADGILIYGSPENLDTYTTRDREHTTHQDRLDAFDDLLADLEQVV